MDYPRAIVMGDPHFKVNNIHDVDIAIEESLKICHELKPDFIVILGDVLDTMDVVHTPAYKRACLWIEMLSRITYVYVIIGNHDYINQVQFLSDEHIFGALKLWPNVKIVDNVIYTVIKNTPFIFTPYVEAGRFLEALDTCPLWKSVHTIFAHQEMKGVKMQSTESIVGDSWHAHYPNIISGHIHETQHLQPNIYYPGSLMQHDHGDHSFKSIWHVTFLDDGSLTYDTHILQGIKSKLTLNMKIKDAYTFDPTPYLEKHHLRLSLEGTSEEKKTFRKSKTYQNFITLGLSIKMSSNVIQETIVNESVALGRQTSSFKFILGELIKKKSQVVQDTYQWLLKEKVL